MVFLGLDITENLIKENQIIGFSDPRPFAEPAKLSAVELAKII